MLADLFKQHSQLLIKHFMMEPGQEWTNRHRRDHLLVRSPV